MLLIGEPSQYVREEWKLPCLIPDAGEVTRLRLHNRKLEELILPCFKLDARDIVGLKLKDQHLGSASCKQDKKLSTHELWKMLYSDPSQLGEDRCVSPDVYPILFDDLRKLCEDGRLYSALNAVDIMDQRGLYVSNNILLCLLQKCMEKADLAGGRKVHCLIIRVGYDTDCNLASHLVNMYLLCGSLWEALQAFRKLPMQSVFLWSAIISAHTRLGKNKQAIELYLQMRELGVKPDGHVLVVVLKACSGLASLDQGRLIHYHSIQRGLGFDVFVVSTLIDMYSNCGSIEDAQKVFDATPERNVVTWNAMIAGHAQHGHGLKALRLYHQMQQRSVEADRVTFVSILKACSSVLAVDQGRLVHQQVVSRGYDSDSLIITRLIDMYGTCGILEDARVVFDEGPKQNLVTWNAMISGYAQHEHTEEALCLFQELQLMGLEANTSTFVSMLKGICRVVAVDQGKIVHGHIIKMGLDKELLVMNTLINMYAKCGSLEDACRAFTGLPRRDLVTWNAMIGAYAYHGQGLEALQLFHLLQREGLEPNWSTLAGSLKACSNVAALDEGKLIHSFVIEKNLEVDVMVVNNLIDMYMKCGSLTDAYRVFTHSPQRDVVTWTSTIAGYVQHGYGEEALKLFQEMQEGGMEPNQVTFVSILKACSSVSALDQGKLVHEYVIGRGYDLELLIINTLIDMYAKCGSLEDGRRVFDKSSRRDVVTWTAMIAAYVQHECGQEALLLFERMQQEGMEPDRAAFVSALKACSCVAALSQGKLIHYQSTERGLGSDGAIVNTLIDMYVKCGSLQDACRVFEETSTRDVVTWTAMIAGCARYSNYQLALQYFQDMEQEGLAPNDVTFLSLLSACSHVGLVDQGFFHLKTMMNLGIEPTLEHYTCLAEVLAHVGNISAAEDVFETLPFRLDMVGWMSLLLYCRRHGNIDVGRRCFDYLVEMDCRNAAGYVLMANMYVAAGMWENAANIEELRQCANAWKKAGKAYIEVDNQVHEFTGGDKLHPESHDIDAKIEHLSIQMKERGYTPLVDLVLQSTSDEEKEGVLCGHCEKQAIVFGILNTPRGASIRVSKNLRMCIDCHNATRVISEIERREIIVADEYCIHVFKDGACSCKDEY